MNKKSGFLLLVALTACVSCTRVETRAATKFEVVTSDSPESQRFEVGLISKDDHKLCVDFADWPNGFGQVHLTSGLAVLVTESGSVDSNGVSFGYCPGGCRSVYVVEPSARLDGFVSYAMFGDPADVARRKERKLVFDTHARVCTREDLRNAVPAEPGSVRSQPGGAGKLVR